MKEIARALGVGLFLLALSTATALGAIIPAGRLPGGVVWSNSSPGVVGGIPNVTTIYTNLSPSGGDDSGNISTAILNCPSNEVVYLNAGTYLIANSVQLGSGFWPNNGMVARGAGMGKTILLMTNGSIFELTGRGYPNAAPMWWTAGYSQGCTNISLSAITNSQAYNGYQLVPGDIIYLTEEEDTNLVTGVGVNGGYGPDFNDLNGQPCYASQCVLVTSVSGTNLTIWPGVYMTNITASLNPSAFWCGDGYTGHPTQVQMCGFEDMTIANQEYVGSFGAIYMQNCYNCWVKNVEVTNTGYSAVALWQDAHITVEDCYFHDCYGGGNSSTYGVNLHTASDCLIENNILCKITAPVLLDGGDTGCVIAYNFLTNMIYSVSPGFMMASMNTHGAHPDMNLFEGNVGALFDFDVVHGSSSHNTALRNYLSGYDAGGIYDYYGGRATNNWSVNDTYCVIVTSWNRDDSFVGNVLGTDTYHQNYEVNAAYYPTNYGKYRLYLYGWILG